MQKSKKRELTRQEKIDFLDELINSGMVVTMPLCESRLPQYIDIYRTAENIIDYINDPDLMCAEHHCVSINDYLSWANANNEPTVCSGITKTGSRCKNTLLQSYPDLKNPQSWLRTKDAEYFCHLHGPTIIACKEFVK